eukprot:11164207-Lingulodinium_polyedra.AAC.1
MKRPVRVFVFLGTALLDNTRRGVCFNSPVSELHDPADVEFDECGCHADHPIIVPHRVLSNPQRMPGRILR